MAVPASQDSTGEGHLTTIRLATALRRWVGAIPLLHSDLPGPDGAPLPFDRSLIYPYAFRHSYAQRHADAGVGVEIRKELMGHKDLSVTQNYYTVSLKRKRQAITIMSCYVHVRTGMLIARSGSPTRYKLTSVAVPFGNCIEPSNVKAGSGLTKAAYAAGISLPRTAQTRMTPVPTFQPDNHFSLEIWSSSAPRPTSTMSESSSVAAS
jgi:hypothetical protein